MIRDHLVDGAKASPLAAYVMALFGGVTLNQWATIAAIVYSVLLIIDKLRQMGAFSWFGSWLRRPKA